MASIVAPMNQRRHLTPLSPRNRLALQNLNNINRQPLSSGFKSLSSKLNAAAPIKLQPSKRPLAIHDEHASYNNENACFPPKRIKSGLAPDLGVFLKPHSVLITENTPSDSIVHAKKKAQPINAKVRSVLGAPMRVGGQQVLSSTNKGVKRSHARFEDAKIRKSSGLKRVDPPKDGNAPISIAAVLHDSTSTTRAILQPVSRSTPKSSGEKHTWGSGKFPKSWMFEIHEDTLEETLTNLVHHHTGILDLSDDEDERKASMSELERLGKENIPPTPDVDTLAMPPPPSTTAAAVTTKSDAMDAERTRSPLSEVPTEELYPVQEEKETRREPSKLRQSISMTDSPVKSAPEEARVEDDESTIASEEESSEKVKEESSETVEEESSEEVEEKVSVLESSEAEQEEEKSVLEISVPEFELEAQTRSMAEDELDAFM